MCGGRGVVGVSAEGRDTEIAGFVPVVTVCEVDWARHEKAVPLTYCRGWV